MDSKVGTFIRGFVKDEGGASLLEYSILIGLITAAVIGFVVNVGGWVNTKWSTLNAALT